MTQHLQEDRAQALRAILVDLPTETATSRTRGSDAVKRSLLTAAALGVAASAALVLAVQPTLSTQPGTVPPTASEGTPAVPGGGSASRVRMYASLEELIADSGAVLLGTVQEQHPGPDGTTVSTFAVERSFSPSGLGSVSPEGAVRVAEGATVQVLTYGSAVTSLPSAALTAGTGYLLFLTPTGLPSAGDDEFFVTGAVAGIYEVHGDRYVRASDTGDRLPGELTADELS